MREIKNTILASNLTNLTNEEIWLYEESSGIGRHFEPKRYSLPSIPSKSERHFYIVDTETYEELLKTGRDLSDIAVMDLHFSGNGRPGKDNECRTFFRLHWGKNMKFVVKVTPKNFYPWRMKVPCCS